MDRSPAQGSWPFWLPVPARPKSPYTSVDTGPGISGRMSQSAPLVAMPRSATLGGVLARRPGHTNSEIATKLFLSEHRRQVRVDQWLMIWNCE
jgi:hypothetical protein